MKSSELLKVLRNEGALPFVERYMFDGYAWCCPTRTGREYSDVKAEISKVFRIAPSDVAIVGSAKYGFSMCPDNKFKKFDNSKSDIDVVIVSRGLFNSTWKHLRQAYFSGEISLKNMYQGDIFRRFIMVGTNEYFDTIYLRDLMTLLEKTRKLASTHLGLSQTLKIRVYSSWSDVKSYHFWSAQKLGETHGIQQ